MNFLTERTVKKRLGELCKQHNILVIHYPCGSPLAREGFPDYMLYVKPPGKKGKHAVLEAKSSDGKLSPVQEEVRELLLSHGATYFIYRATEEDNAQIINWSKS